MNENSKYIILNWGIPAIPSFPSPAMSVLKSQLNQYGYEVKVVYWNLILKPVITHYWGDDKEEYTDHLVYYLSPLYAYLAVEYSDENSINLLHDQWQKTKQLHIESGAFVEHILQNIALFRKIVKETILHYNYDKCLFAGFYQKLFQMYGADIIAREVKNIYPDTICCLGGIDTKAEALAALDNFSVFDHALWGEGEMPLVAYAEHLNHKIPKEDIGNFVWRDGIELRVSKPNKFYLNLDEIPLPDYSDYFEQKTIDDAKVRLPIEGSRGCHWARCKFCFHNEGVRYRRKSPKKIADEIRKQISKYGIYQIAFLDNDTIGKDISVFHELLDELIAIKEQNKDFYISRAEVVTRKLDADIILKMAQAGFSDVQIGYEALSDELLQAIHKCNSFSSNFLFIKWALTYGIKIRGANLIMNLLEESEPALYESLDNLRFLRFMLAQNRFMHIYSTLWIKTSSRYYSVLRKSQKLHEWHVYKSFKYLPAGYIKPENEHILQFFVKMTYHPIWDDIENKEWEYYAKNYRYELIPLEQGVMYREYSHDEIIETMLLDVIDWHILCSANRKVISLSELPMTVTDVILEKLVLLKQKGILYYNRNFENIVTVINTEVPFNQVTRYTS